MFFQLIKKNILIRFNKTLIILLSIIVGSSIVFAFSAIYLDISAKMSKELRTYGANFFIGPKDLELKSITMQDYKKVLDFIEKNKLIASSGELFGLVRLDLGNAILAGIDFSQTQKLNPFWQVDGSWINLSFDDRNCLVGKNLAKTMELKIGSKVTIINEENGFKHVVQVKGIVETGTNSDDHIFVNLHLAQKILNNLNINYASLSLSYNENEIEELSKKINSQIPSIDSKPIRKISQSEGKILDKIKTLMALVAFMILSITTLCVNTTLIASVQERGKEIALQKALGANDGMIIKQFLAENSIICIAGVIIGSFVGFGLAEFMAKAVFNSFVDIKFWVLPITFFISYFSTMLASFFPIKNALTILPAVLLRGE